MSFKLVNSTVSVNNPLKHLKYQRFTQSDCKDVEIRKFEFNSFDIKFAMEFIDLVKEVRKFLLKS